MHVPSGRIDAVYLFDAVQLLSEQRSPGAKVGVASGVREVQWAAAEVYPTAANPRLPLSEEQRRQFALFGG